MSPAPSARTQRAQSFSDLSGAKLVHLSGLCLGCPSIAWLDSAHALGPIKGCRLKEPFPASATRTAPPTHICCDTCWALGLPFKPETDSLTCPSVLCAQDACVLSLRSLSHSPVPAGACPAHYRCLLKSTLCLAGQLNNWPVSLHNPRCSLKRQAPPLNR